MGLVHEYDGYSLVCGIFPGQSASVSGLLCDCVDFDCAAALGNEEMGLLDCMAVCEYSKLDPILEGWFGVYADRQLLVSS